MKRRSIALAAVVGLGLLVSGCDSESDAGASPSPSIGVSASAQDVESVAEIKVSGDLGTEPTAKFDTPFSVTAPVTRVETKGTGESIAKGQQVNMNVVAFSGKDATKQGSTWAEEKPISLIVGDEQGSLLTEDLDGGKVGMRLVVAIPDASSGVTTISVIEVISVADIAKRAEGEPVTPAAGLPTVTLDDTGKPSITIPEGYPAPTTLVIQPLITGTGPAVTADQTVIAHYTGWKLDGTQFDSSWDRGEPSTFPLNGVIAGWTQGLTGQTVGSQVLLVIPADLAYAASEGHELQKETLVFVVDILAAN